MAPDGSILVASYGQKDQIFRFSRDGSLMSVWGERGDGPDQFLRPEGITVGEDGTVLVVDCGHHRVLRFSLEGEHLQTIGKAGRAPGEFDNPFDIDSLSDGGFVVVDKAGCRVQRFGGDGTLIGAQGGAGTGAGRLSEPRGIAVGEQDGQIRVLIADTGNHRVVVTQLPGGSS